MVTVEQIKEYRQQTYAGLNNLRSSLVEFARDRQLGKDMIDSLKNGTATEVLKFATIVVRIKEDWHQDPVDPSNTSGGK